MINPELISQLQRQLAIVSSATHEYIASQRTVTEEESQVFKEGTVEAAQGLLERAEEWREAPVVRDESGRFATKATPEPDEVEPTEEAVEPIPASKILQEKATTFSAGLKKFEQEQVKKVNKVILDRTTDRLKDIADQRKDSAGELVELMFGKYAKQARKQLAELCKPINPTLAEAVEEDPYQEVSADIKRLQRQASAGNTKALVRDLPKAFQYTVAKYNKTIDNLQNAEGDNAELMQAAGKALALTVPITTFMAASLGAAAVTGVLTHAIAAAPIFAAGGAAVGATKVATGILVGTTAWKIKSKSIEEGLDILEVDNKMTRKLLKWATFLAGDLSMLPTGAVPSSLEIPPYLYEPGTAGSVLSGIKDVSGLVGDVANSAFMSVINVTGEDLLNFAIFPTLNAIFGDALAPGRNLSGKSYSQMREIKRAREKAIKTLKDTKEKAVEYNKQFEEALLTLQQLPDLEAAI